MRLSLGSAFKNLEALTLYDDDDYDNADDHDYYYYCYFAKNITTAKTLRSPSLCSVSDHAVVVL